MTRIFLLLHAAWVLAACAPQPPPSALDATVVAAPEAPVLSDWDLRSSNGDRFDEFRFAGRWTLVFIGYLTCPDVCPTTMSTLAATREVLGSSMPDVVFISVDPDRDTPERLASYGTYFDPSIQMTSGSQQQLSHAVGQLGAAWTGPDADGAVDHSTSLFLIDPSGHVHSYLLRPHDAERLAADIRVAMQRPPAVHALLWAPPTPPGAMSAAAYGTLTAATERRLVGVSSPRFANAHLHVTSVQDGMAHMGVASDGWAVGPARPIELRPGADHLMLMGAGIDDSGSLPLRLVFDDVEVLALAEVRPR